MHLSCPSYTRTMVDYGIHCLYHIDTVPGVKVAQVV